MGCYHSQKIRQQVQQQRNNDNNNNNNNNGTRNNVNLNYPVQVSNSRGLHARFQKRSRRRVIL